MITLLLNIVNNKYIYIPIFYTLVTQENLISTDTTATATTTSNYYKQQIKIAIIFITGLPASTIIITNNNTTV